MLTSMILNDLEPLKYKVLVLFAIFGYDAHFKSELRQHGWRKTWTTCVWNF